MRAEAALERYADALRREAGQDTLPVDVELIASVLGVRLRREHTRDFAGRLHAEQDGRLVVSLNAADPPVRQRFTCAHELMHTAFAGFARGEGAPAAAPPALRSSPGEEERLCDAGAAALLMPRALVERRYELADGLVAVEALARDAAVSLEAAANRLAGLPGPPVALLVLSRAHRPRERAALQRGALPAARLRVRYARPRGVDAFLVPAAAAARGSAAYRALAGRPVRAREPLPGARDGAPFDVEAKAYGSPRRPLVLLVARPVATSAHTSPSWRTASRSSLSSATVRSIRSREKSGTSRPSTISHLPPAQRHGNEETSPSSTP
jgi:Zn-dependent peptidase ImmA (M78 family)